MKPLSIEGAWLRTPTLFPDDRGTFHEAFRAEEFTRHLGRPLDLAQMNVSVSRRGVVRGVHFADVPPGQAKYVTCPRGAVLDVVVDVRTGSPTYGSWEAVELDERNHHALFLAEGLGHAFVALTDDATVTYLCSQGYAPGREHGVHPFDPALAVAWPDGIVPVLSPKDAAAPTLREAEEAGILPSYEECVAYATGGRAF
ncbi:dTDP-4-dehydrorhamnose 3,5-epimerase [Streptomyces luteireticuli]|uniref:dTDP-4-dehydrorhamnose 3,5-epimerase n=1 Tax=Streptomyces luteireticuli TaxID=173858 RepID=A0ABP3IIN8_9ACTN